MMKKSDFNINDIAQVIREVSDSLEEKGYNSVNQIVGYLMSGDPGYISNYQDSRKKITSFKRTELLNYLVKETLNK